MQIAECVQVAYSTFVPLTESQRVANLLYDFGLNVVPLPTPQEIRAQPWADPNEKKKLPWFKEWFFYNRLHRCGPECWERERKTGRKCLPDGASFNDLTIDCNLSLMAGRTSDNLVDFDCDTQRALESLMNEFSKRNLPYDWGWTSHAGRGHIAIRLAEGEAANAPKCNFPDVNIIGNRHYAVCPPSLHWSGEFYVWMNDTEPVAPPPVLHLEEVAFLGVTLQRAKKNQWEEPDTVGLPKQSSYLSRANRAILQAEWKEGVRSLTLIKPALDIAAHVNLGNIPEVEGLDMLERCAERSNYPIKEVQSMFRYALKKNPSPANTYYTQKEDRPMKPWEAATEFAKSNTWTGRTAQSDRAVFLACCKRAMLDGREMFRASIREVSEIANISSNHTVIAALKRLVKMDLIKYATSDKGNGVNLYRFTDKVLKFEGVCKMHHDIRLGEENTLVQLLKNQPTQQQDVFKSLGKVAYRCWNHLKQKPDTVTGTATATGQNIASVSIAMKALRLHGLIVKGAKGMHTGIDATDAQLEAIAAALGTLGYSDRRKRLHVRERDSRLNLRLAQVRERWGVAVRGIIVL